jgi:hypothetical protein
MRIHRTVLSIAVVLACAAASRLHADETADAACGRLLSPSALQADVGPGFAAVTFSDSHPEIWTCIWETGSAPTRRVSLRYHHTSDRFPALFDEYVARMKKSGLPAESIAGVGLQASGSTVGESFVIAFRAPQAFVTMAVVGGISRDQTIALARRVAAATPQTLADARKAVAEIRARPPDRKAEVKDMVVRRDGLPLPCEQLLPRAEVVAALGEGYNLTYADDPRPGFSFCEWRRPDDTYAMSVGVHGELEFSSAKLSGPAQFFDAEMARVAPSCTQPPEPVEKLGEQATLCTSGDRHHSVIVRRPKDVIVVTCPDCESEEAVALARAAAQ